MFIKENFTDYQDFIKRFRLSIPENFNFAFDVIDAKAAANPEVLAMIHIDDSGQRKEYSMGFFADQSSRLAASLRENGISKGDKVMIILYRRVEFWVTMLALHKIGAVAVPSPSLLTPGDIIYRVNFAGIKAVVCEDSITDKVNEARLECPELSVLVQAGDKKAGTGWLDYEQMVIEPGSPFHENDRPGGNDPLLIFFSSGTTGPPKMVEHTHNYPLGHWVTAAYWHDLEPGDIHLTLADTGWGKAVWGKFYGQWMADAVVFVYDFRGKFTPAGLLEILTKHKVQTFCAPPTVYRFLIREDMTKYDLSALKHCTTAGELLNESVFHSWKKITGLPIYEGYGQTETTLQIATFPFMQPKPGSIGKPAPGWNIVLLDETGNSVAVGDEGEICVALDESLPTGLFTGYLQEPEKTASVIKDGFYHTGDKAWMDEDGYLWFLGRVDDLIKSSGYRIGPFEVESALITHPAVIEAAVTGVTDEVRGQIVKATVVLAPGFEPDESLTRQLQDHVKNVTAPYKYPRIIEYVSELPKTISGKIKRAEIREKDRQAQE
ncbi:AMP-binding protein [Desulfonatronovibrio magnus]|uniref:AMP-binding protein n=1 Tax=Desulfonatronovibrio magnus TaxID=698827 RepID=UPI0005EB2E19|nr:AMP-binding protein [Desulfonatronovibrio magnus]RQD55689.1 MAG: acyl-CoA synthetase [Desulfonatronovibrio sp. MSAO_Bac4]